MSKNLFQDYTAGRPSLQGPVVRVKLDQAHSDPNTADVPGSFRWPDRDVQHARNADGEKR